MRSSSAARQVVTWAPLAALLIVLLPALSAAQELAKPAAATAQTPGTSVPVLTEAKRREINSEAVVWFRKASEQGDAFGSFRYGWLYLEKPGPGRLDPIATRVGVDSLKLSAEQGYSVAAFVVGEIFSGRMFKYHVETAVLITAAFEC